MELNNESKTLFIPLLGKALMSKEKIFLNDPKAEEIMGRVDYDFKSLKQSKWLSMYMSMRALILDELCNQYISEHPEATILHLGCGLDSRCLRVQQTFRTWYDVDYEKVIAIRQQFYDPDPQHQMIGSSVTTDYQWLDRIESWREGHVLVVAEGLTMYLTEEEVKELLSQLHKKFGAVHLLFDAYSTKGIKASKIKNPVNQMDAKVYYGLDTPEEFLSLNPHLGYVATHLIKKDDNALHGSTKFIFNKLYCGKISQSMYKIYEFKLEK